MKKGIVVFFLLVPAMLYSQGSTGYALQFDGSASYARLACNSLNVSGNFTLEAWINVGSHSGWMVLFNKNTDPGMNHDYTDEFSLDIDPTDHLFLIMGSTEAWAWTGMTSTDPLTEDTWTHVAVVMNGQTASILINGTPSGSTEVTLPRWAATNSADVYAGASPTGSLNSYYHGLITEVRLWNTARPAGDIQAAMNQKLQGNESNLMAYYSMNAGPGAGSVLADDQTNGTSNTGTITGASWTGSNAPLPIQLYSFVVLQQAGGTKLQWATASEVNNYGFYVQRKSDVQSGYVDLPGGFVAGHGTTTTREVYAFVDNSAAPGLWSYRLKQVDLDNSVHFSDPVGIKVAARTVAGEGPVPTAFELAQNYPNPFNPATTISYGVPRAGKITLKVYDALGREVAVLVDGVREAGIYSVSFNGSSLASGVYFYRLVAETFVSTRRLSLVK